MYDFAFLGIKSWEIVVCISGLWTQSMFLFLFIWVGVVVVVVVVGGRGKQTISEPKARAGSGTLLLSSVNMLYTSKSGKHIVLSAYVYVYIYVYSGIIQRNSNEQPTTTNISIYANGKSIYIYANGNI